MSYSPEEIKQNIKSNYNLNIDDTQLIDEGVMNLNFICSSGSDEFIFKIYNFKSKEEISFEIEVLDALSKNDFPSPKILKNKDGNFVSSVEGKNYILYPCIEGQTYSKLDKDIIFAIGVIEGRMHKILKELKPEFDKKGWDPDYLNDLISKNKKKMLSDEHPWLKDLVLFVEAEIKKYSFPKGLPKGITHQDIKPENILINKGKISGIIDFDNSYLGFLLFDIATTIIWSCFTNEKLDEKMLDAFLNGYNKERIITELENKYVLDSIKFRLLREIFIGPFITMHNPELSKERAEYFYRLYKNIVNINSIKI